MSRLTTQKPIDYLLIGHITSDLQPDGSRKLGGTASFSGLTAHQLGHRVGLLTSYGDDAEISALSPLQLYNAIPGQTTCFRNISTPQGRRQYCYQQGSRLNFADVPSAWRKSAIVHLGPVVNEIDPDLFDGFADSMLCATPQGMLRSIAGDGSVTFRDLADKERLLPQTQAVVLSFEDLQGDQHLVDEYARLCQLLVITENKDGARVYRNGEVRSFSAPGKNLVEDTGAGDIFAACFFHRLFKTRDPWEAARFAIELSSNSVTRRYLDSVPRQEEIEHADAGYLNG